MIRFLAGAFWSDGRVPEGKWIKWLNQTEESWLIQLFFFSFRYTLGVLPISFRNCFVK